jgi:hypothetical protein
MNAVPSLPAIPDATTAPLPVVYEAAQKALVECSKIDECKAWADKAAALASYARQAKDDSLRVMAVRIQARAQRRAGELLKQITPGTGGRPSENPGGRPPEFSRTQAAQDAGLSDHQRKTALRIANIPEPQFEDAVEGVKPPTITDLAARGTVSRRMEAPPPQTYVPDDIQPAPIGQATKALNLLRELAVFCGITDPVAVARACGTLDIEALQGYVETIDSWLDRFAPNLPSVEINPTDQ